MFRQLDYQKCALDTFATYIDELKDARRNAEGVATLIKRNPELRLQAPDFLVEAWEAMRDKNLLPASRHAIPFSPRLDGCGRSVPNAVLKSPEIGRICEFGKLSGFEHPLVSSLSLLQFPSSKATLYHLR